MDDALTASDFEHRLPAAYSQGFAHVRVVVPTAPVDETALATASAPDSVWLGTSLPVAYVGRAKPVAG